jgi:hypothetical protein
MTDETLAALLARIEVVEPLGHFFCATCTTSAAAPPTAGSASIWPASGLSTALTDWSAMAD